MSNENDLTSDEVRAMWDRAAPVEMMASTQNWPVVETMPAGRVVLNQPTAPLSLTMLWQASAPQMPRYSFVHHAFRTDPSTKGTPE